MKTIRLLFAGCLLLLLFCDKPTNHEDPATWTLQRDKQDDVTYYSIFFSDKSNGWIIGYDGTIKKTSNGGTEWETQESGVASNLWDISFINNSDGWISGADNTILKTINGGKDWVTLSQSGSGNKVIVEMKFVDENTGWISNNNGEILRTSDGGLTWDIKKSGIVGGSRLAVFDAQTIHALGHTFAGDKLYKTTDGGEHWDSLLVPVPRDYNVSGMFFVNSSDGYVIFENRTGGTIITEYPVLMTKDGGESWTSSEPLENGAFRCVYFINEQIGWVAGGQNVYKTIDGGNSWSLDFSPTDRVLSARDMYFINDRHGWILNWDGQIYKYE